MGTLVILFIYMSGANRLANAELVKDQPLSVEKLQAEFSPENLRAENGQDEVAKE